MSVKVGDAVLAYESGKKSKILYRITEETNTHFRIVCGTFPNSRSHLLSKNTWTIENFPNVLVQFVPTIYQNEYLTQQILGKLHDRDLLHLCKLIPRIKYMENFWSSRYFDATHSSIQSNMDNLYQPFFSILLNNHTVNSPKNSRIREIVEDIGWMGWYMVSQYYDPMKVGSKIMRIFSQGPLSVLQYIHEMGAIEYTQDGANSAIGTAQREILDHLKSLGIAPSTIDLAISNRLSNQQIYDLERDYNIQSNELTYILAILRGDLQLVKHYRNNLVVRGCTPIRLCEIARANFYLTNRLDVLKFLTETDLCSGHLSYTFSQHRSCRINDVEFTQYMIDHGVIYDQNAIDYAAAYDNTDVVELISKRFNLTVSPAAKYIALIRKTGISSRPKDVPMEEDHDVLKTLPVKTLDRLFETAIWSGSTYVLDLLVSAGRHPNTKDLMDAILSKNFEMALHLIDVYKLRPNERMIGRLCSGGCLGVLKQLKSRSVLILTPECFDRAISTGYINVAQFILDEGIQPNPIPSNDRILLLKQFPYISNWLQCHGVSTE